MSTRQSLAAVALAVLAGVLAAQTRPPGRDLAVEDAAVVFRHVGVEQGLPSRSVLSVAQDALGFVWVGTDEGLARYDGVEVVPYRHAADTTSLSSDVVQALAPGAGGVVWVGTSGGLDRYDPATDRFRRISGLDNVLSLEPDGEGGAWVGTRDGLAHVTASGAADARDRARPSDPSGLPHPEVTALHLAPDGRLWVGTRDGLAVRRGGRYRTFRPDAGSGPRGLSVSSIASGEGGTLLVGTMGRALFSLDPGTGQFTPIDIGPDIDAQNVTDVYPDPEGTVWVSTLGGGLRRLDPGASAPRVYEPVSGDPGSLAGDDVTALMEDRQGILWVATFSGLDRFDRARGTVLRLRHDDGDPGSLASDRVRAVLRTDDALWVGAGRSLDRSTDGRTFRHLRLPQPEGGQRAVRALYQDRQGTVWVGTSAGLYRTDGTSLAPADLPGETARLPVTAVQEDGDGRFWLGTPRGLVLYDRDGGPVRVLAHRDRQPASLASSRVLALAKDVGGALWVGTDAGLCRLDDAAGAGRFTCFRPDPADPEALADGTVYALWPRRDRSLWVGTAGGLHRLDTGDTGAGFTRYRAADTDLPSDSVQAVVEDASGFLWLSTSGGLSRFEPLTESFYRRPGTESARSLTSAAAVAPDGQLLFGSTRGLLTFSPQKLRSLNAAPPQVAITGVEVAGQPVAPGPDAVIETAAPVANAIRLGPDQAYLTIQYAGLHFSDPAANTFRYRMDGLFDDWREVGTAREATFSALPAGRYTFEVQAANADGVGFGARTASIGVVVAPPWWRRWWALLGFAGLAVLALVRADRWQRARLLHQERERAERRETELRAETAEMEHRKAAAEADRQRAEAAALKAENDRKAAEIERTRDVQAANDKLAQANGQLEASLRDLRETQAQLVQSEKLASLGQLTAGIAHEIKNPLNFVNNFADLSVELAQELREELAGGGARPATEMLEELEPVLTDLQDNARRIREHGQRADRIVRSMLLHSRGGASDRGRVDINKFVDEYVNLAFHGARANDSGFHVEVVRDFDDAAGEVDIVPQEFGRVLINLLTNAFHTVTERAHAGGSDYAPTVTARTYRDGDQVAVEVADNGTGIPEPIRAKIFEPFFTTKPTGEGTGLGLSLAHDIVTQVHGGQMEVESAEGEGTTFRVLLPAGGARPPQSTR